MKEGSLTKQEAGRRQQVQHDVLVCFVLRFPRHHDDHHHPVHPYYNRFEHNTDAPMMPGGKTERCNRNKLSLSLYLAFVSCAPHNTAIPIKIKAAASSRTNMHPPYSNSGNKDQNKSLAVVSYVGEPIVKFTLCY